MAVHCAFCCIPRNRRNIHPIGDNMKHSHIEQHDGYCKLIWSDGSKLIISNADALKLNKENKVKILRLTLKQARESRGYK